VVEPRQQPVEVAGHVQQAAGLGVEAELGPAQRLDELLERPDPARGADEGVGARGHRRLALMQGLDDDELGQAAVGDLAGDHPARDHAGDGRAGSEGGVGEGAHQAGAPAAVHDAQVAAGELAGEVLHCGTVGGPGAGPAGEEDADAREHRGQGATPGSGGRRDAPGLTLGPGAPSPPLEEGVMQSFVGRMTDYMLTAMMPRAPGGETPRPSGKSRTSA